MSASDASKPPGNYVHQPGVSTSSTLACIVQSETGSSRLENRTDKMTRATCVRRQRHGVKHMTSNGVMVSFHVNNIKNTCCDFQFDIGRLLDPRFDYCNLVWNNYLSNVSAEMLANVSVLKGFLLFRDNPELCSDLFNTDDIAGFITGLCTG